MQEHIPEKNPLVAQMWQRLWSKTLSDQIQVHIPEKNPLVAQIIFQGYYLLNNLL